MSEIEKKIKDLLKLLKLDIHDEKAMVNDFNSVLKMFDELVKVEIPSQNSKLSRKTIRLNELRDDKALNSEFRPDFYGKYLIVPLVSKK